MVLSALIPRVDKFHVVLSVHLSRLQHVTGSMVSARMPRLQLEGDLDRFEERTAKTGWSNLVRSPSLLEVNANLSRRLANSLSPILKASRRPAAPMGSLKVKRLYPAQKLQIESRVKLLAQPYLIGTPISNDLDRGVAKHLK